MGDRLWAGIIYHLVPANHVVLVRLTLDQFSFWPKLPPTRDLASKISKKIPGVTPSRTYPQRGYTPCAGAQAPPLLGTRSRKPFPQIKIYHYTPADLIANTTAKLGRLVLDQCTYSRRAVNTGDRELQFCNCAVQISSCVMNEP